VEYTITDFGAVGDGKTINTSFIQKAIDAAEKAGGGKVVVPTGVFMSGTIWLKDNVELHLQPGAVLKASENLDDYNKTEDYKQNWDCLHETWLGKHLIIIHEKKNVSITGCGTIDGNGEGFFAELEPKEYYDNAWSSGYAWSYGFVASKDTEKMRPGQMISFIECENVRVLDVNLQNSPCWTCHIHGCNNVTIRGVHIYNKRYLGCTDGIDIDTSSNVTVSDCIIDTGDDAITFRCASKRLLGGKTACEFVTVSNCVLAGSSSAFRIGVGIGEIRNINVSNIVIKRAGVAINCMTAYDKKGCAKIENILFNNIVAYETSYPFAINQMNNGYVRNFHISNYTVQAFCRSSISSQDDGAISDVSVKDMNINFVNPPFKVPPHKVENRGKCAVEICGAKNISLENINVKVDEILKNVFTDFSKHTNGENIKEVNCNFNV